jgi:enoyl-CoA hydratase/carnithine racemase
MSDTTGPRVRVEWHGRIAELVLDRPARRNAMDAELWTTLRDRARALAEEDPRAVVLTGAGDHFCSGMDLTPANALVMRLMPAIQTGDTEALRELVRDLKATMDAIASIPAPVIAAVEGSCLGAGLEVALCADLRIASETATFSLPETRFGMVPDVGGTVRLSRLVGRGRAAQLILTGDSVDPATASAWGLVNEVVPAGNARERALELAAAVTRCAPTATREALAVLRSHPGDEGRFDAETEAGVRALASGEVLEGITSFMQKREARW